MPPTLKCCHLVFYWAVLGDCWSGYLCFLKFVKTEIGKKKIFFHSIHESNGNQIMTVPNFIHLFPSKAFSSSFIKGSESVNNAEFSTVHQFLIFKKNIYYTLYEILPLYVLLLLFYFYNYICLLCFLCFGFYLVCFMNIFK